MPCFLFKFFFNNSFKSTKNTLQNWNFNFLRRSPHIFICFLKNHMTWFCDFWSKIFENIKKKFLISCSKIFKLIFLELLVENIENGYFNFIQIGPRFVHSLLFILWIIIFVTNYGLAEIHWSSLLSRIKKNISFWFQKFKFSIST